MRLRKDLEAAVTEYKKTHGSLSIYDYHLDVGKKMSVYKWVGRSNNHHPLPETYSSPGKKTRSDGIPNVHFYLDFPGIKSLHSANETAKAEWRANILWIWKALPELPQNDIHYRALYSEDIKALSANSQRRYFLNHLFLALMLVSCAPYNEDTQSHRMRISVLIYH